MPIVDSRELPPDSRTREWWYNSLDCAVTAEIYEVLSRKNTGHSVYEFERALQGPALDMMLRGFRIDPYWRSHQITEFSKKEALIEEKLNRLAHGVWGRDLNPRSSPQLQEFFYNELGLPPQFSIKKGEKKISTDREALEKLNQYLLAQPFISCILLARDVRKKLGVLRTGVDPDGRMRCTYNVCGTETGRWASSRNVFGRGTNLQNITPELRRMFIADPGYILVVIDGEQAESRSVGFIHGRLFGDWRYLDACEAGDLHTFVCTLVWPDLPWTGDPKLDREIADRAFYRWFSYRDMAKRGGHGTNYYGKPWTMARHLKVPQDLIVNFQRKYLGAFAMSEWHTWVAEQLSNHMSLTTYLGRTRDFFGRPNDEATLREAIAYEPQSTVGDLINEGGHRVWREFAGVAQVLGQYHDAYAFQIPEDRLDLIPRMIETFQVPVSTRSRTMVIPGEAKVGWNWGECEMDKKQEKRTFRDGNPDGLRKWKGSENRRRTEDPTAGVLDRVLY